jgi:CheY-like chemotaxis protein/HPt (histidine-containing phosphotransfer) domain-containing protein
MKTVLAVDDSPSMRQMVAFTLKSSGYEVIEAVDGLDGLDKARAGRVSLVLTDQNMPRMDGLTLIRRLRGLPEYRAHADPDAHHRGQRRDEGRGARRRRHRLAGEALRSAQADRSGEKGHRLKVGLRNTAMAIDLSQFQQLFFDEAAEHLACLERLLLGLDLARPEAGAVDEMFRALHSVKGSAATFGFQDMAALAHDAETLLGRLRKGEIGFGEAMQAALIEVGDLLKAQLAAFMPGGAGARRRCRTRRRPPAAGSWRWPSMPPRRRRRLPPLAPQPKPKPKRWPKQKPRRRKRPTASSSNRRRAPRCRPCPKRPDGSRRLRPRARSASAWGGWTAW